MNRAVAGLLVAVPVLVLLSLALAPRGSSAEEVVSPCVDCHEKASPGLVAQWRASRHAMADPPTTCEVCHGDAHRTGEDAAKAKMPTPKKCAMCHQAQVERFAQGKHALGELSAAAIPMVSNQPKEIRAFGCAGCHEIGKRHADGSVGQCDSCHTRHLFSKAEAKMPEACETCHMGEDHSQYEMWRSSKHGVIHHLQGGLGRAPVCQTCHMPTGDHGVMTGWGFLGLRLPIADPQWQDDAMTIVKAVGPWPRDEAGMKARVDAIAALKLARLDETSFDAARAAMVATCAKCHSATFGKEHLELADGVIRETTKLLAEAVRIVEGLYADGVLPEAGDGPTHPDLLLFYDSPTEIEQELYRMFLFHRQKAFQGAIHMNPDYMHWYGWAPMKSSLVRIRALAAKMSEAKKN